MSDKEDGGQAFPCAGSEYGYPVAGMNLRDYFAAKIIQSLISSAKGENNLGAPYPENNANFSMAAYAIADAMLAERAK